MAVPNHIVPVLNSHLAERLQPYDATLYLLSSESLKIKSFTVHILHSTAQRIMDTNTCLTRDVAKSLLRGDVSNATERKHSWSTKWAPSLQALRPGTVLDDLWDSVLLRTYDYISVSKPDDQYRMLARDPRIRLDTEAKRKRTLAIHINHKERVNTPYISFTNSPDALQNLAEFRTSRNRGKQTIVVVDPRVRFELGLPVLRLSEEMSYYDVQSPYSNDTWSENHYLCLWEVRPEEVVGKWAWENLAAEPNWFETIIMPAIAHQRERRLSQQAGNTIPQPGRAMIGNIYHHYRQILNEVNASIGPANRSLSETFCQPPSVESDEESDCSFDEDESDSERIEDNGVYWCDSDDSDERVCNENWSGQLEKMYDDLRIGEQ